MSANQIQPDCFTTHLLHFMDDHQVRSRYIMPTEKELDKALAEALRTDAKVLAWFVGKTKFKGILPTHDWSRTDYPWCYLEMPVLNPDTGVTETKRVAGETDILLVLKTRMAGRSPCTLRTSSRRVRSLQINQKCTRCALNSG
jgi:hypothetical protein